MPATIKKVKTVSANARMDDHAPNTPWDELFALYRVIPLKDNKNSISIVNGNLKVYQLW
jgi:hypothetical protein